MNLSEIHNDARVLVDTNVLIYARLGRSPQSRGLLTRCKGKAVQGIITPFIIAEFCHRRMTQEAKAGGFAASNPARALAANPGLIRSLAVYSEDTRALLSGELELASIHPEDFSEALMLQKMHGLLTIDSINLAVAKRLGTSEIATADAAFDNVPGVIIYKPEDITS